MLHPHANVVVDSLLHGVKSVFGGQHLNTKQGSGLHDGVDWAATAQGVHIGNAEVAGGRLNALLGKHDDVPRAAIAMKDSEQDTLQQLM